MNQQSHSEATLSRLLAVNWKSDFMITLGHSLSRGRLMQEYLRRAARQREHLRPVRADDPGVGHVRCGQIGRGAHMVQAVAHRGQRTTEFPANAGRLRSRHPGPAESPDGVEVREPITPNGSGKADMISGPEQEWKTDSQCDYKHLALSYRTASGTDPETSLFRCSGNCSQISLYASSSESVTGWISLLASSARPTTLITWPTGARISWKELATPTGSGALNLLAVPPQERIMILPSFRWVAIRARRILPPSPAATPPGMPGFE